MKPTNCIINAFLANVPDNYSFNIDTEAFLEQQIDRILKKAKAPVKQVLFIPYAENAKDCEPYMVAAIQSILPEGIQVDCILKDQEAEMINNAQAILVGGGSISRLSKEVSGVASNLWLKVLDGTPFIGINAGAELVSSQNLALPANPCGINYFSFQLISAYTGNKSQQPPAAITKLFNDRPELEYAIGLPNLTDSEGSGIVLEDNKSGLAGGAKTDQAGGGQLPIGEVLYVYKREQTDSIQRLNITEGERNNLPIEYLT